ncbi:DNA-binding transcriptional LysR family regulator [Actinocorallia herbida]|uniref:DNA-binding transcriptional LysR family regulator n=1 Tax=Actinocorallia herbida TaxID=58109 RepID=A0A3N1D365_9ACTN|nr:LysR family transcriptional regulator [Actinocorallia herbida]ROO87959.1 DNA-binding transcriptional LysR family regulator [Actinocorallia herbida]
MDIQHVRSFVAVAEELHFGRAAERLHITPSPLSRHIRDLEKELGTDLFDRRYHQVELTAFGRRFLEPARQLLERFEALRRLGPALAPPLPEPLRIGATPLAPPQVLDLVLETAHEVDSESEPEITLEPSAVLLRLLADRKLDLAVVHLPLGDARLASIRLAEYRFGIALRNDDELARRPTLKIEDVAERRILVGSSKVQPLAMAEFRRHLVEAGATRLRELPHSDVVQLAALVGRSRDVTVVSMSSLSRRIFDSTRVALVPLDEPALRLEVGVAWAPPADGAEAAGSVVERIVSALGSPENRPPLAL